MKLQGQEYLLYQGIPKLIVQPISGNPTHHKDLFRAFRSQGYQYQSLNSYHLAIALVHERIEGFSVGQCPAIT